MKVSTRGKYAMIAMVNLALARGGNMVTVKELAAREGMSLTYLEQLFVGLRKAGILTSIRGPNGGFQLALAPEEIRVIDILKAVGETVDSLKDGAGARRPESGSEAEVLAGLMWEGLSAHVHVYLHQMTLKDVIQRAQSPCPAFSSLEELAT